MKLNVPLRRNSNTTYYSIKQEGEHTLCPMNRKARSCGLKFHNMTQLSPDPEASCFNDGENDTEVT